MNSRIVWKGAMLFDGLAGEFNVPMDAKTPIGKGSAPTPKELVALGLGGCTAMDVAALLKKHKQNPESFEVTVDVTPSEGRQPAVFESAQLTYKVSGQVDSAVLIEAVALSQSKYCGVSAMLAKAFPIRYKIELNGEEIAVDEARFST